MALNSAFTLTANEIYETLANMIISQEVFADNLGEHQTLVDKADYEKLKAENKKLLDSIVNGTEVALPAVEKDSISDLRNKLINSNEDGLSSLEYTEVALKLRERLIEEGQEDPFVPHGSQYSPTQIDYDRAHRVATILQECVDNAEGDDATFLAELNKRTR